MSKITLTPEEGDRIKQLKAFLDSIYVPGQYLEIRALTAKRRAIRCVTADTLVAAKKAVALNRFCNVYYTLNPISPSSPYIEERSSTGEIDKVVAKEYGEHLITASDGDIAYRHLYLIDIDPHRPSETRSTDEQKAEAWIVAQKVMTYLESREWPEPTVLDSGNGYHLLYRADDCLISDDWHTTLCYLNQMHHTSDPIRVDLDTSVANASRISRLPYTFNRKGEEPYRMASVVSYPETFEAVSESAITEIANRAIDDGTIPAVVSTRTSDLVIDHEGVLELIAEYPDHLHLGRVTERGDRTYFELEICPFKGDAHKGQRVGAGKTALVLTDTILGFHCFSSDCADHTIGSLLRHLYEETGHWPETQIWEEIDLEDLFTEYGPQWNMTTDDWYWQNETAPDHPATEPVTPSPEITHPHVFPWQRRAIPDYSGLRFEDMLGAFIERAKKMEDHYADASQRYQHQRLVERIICERDSPSVAKMLGHIAVQELQQMSALGALENRPILEDEFRVLVSNPWFVKGGKDGVAALVSLGVTFGSNTDADQSSKPVSVEEFKRLVGAI